MIVPVTYTQHRLGYHPDCPMTRDLYAQGYTREIRRFVRCELQTGHGPAPALPPHLYVSQTGMQQSFPRPGTHPDRVYTYKGR